MSTGFGSRCSIVPRFSWEMIQFDEHIFSTGWLKPAPRWTFPVTEGFSWKTSDFV